jgi:general stress protein 26
MGLKNSQNNIFIIMKDEIKLFNEKKVRTHWNEKLEKWYFAIVDVIEISTVPKGS